MCGRFTLTGNLMWLIRLLCLEPLPVFADRFNIAPGQPLLVFMHDIDRGGFRHDFLSWGFMPAFVKDPGQISNLINARAESVSRKIAFKSAYKYRRCIIPASGFYEWQKQGRQNTPWYFSAADQQHLCLAGIWEIWHGEGGEQVNSCAILTTQANKLVAPVHQRMPVIIDKADIKRWLDPQSDYTSLAKMLGPAPEGLLKNCPVSSKVNSVRNDSPECIAPYQIKQPGLFDIFP